MLTAVLGLWTAAAAADCGELTRQVEPVRASGDLPRLQALYDQVVADPSCDGRVRTWLGQTVARDMARMVQAELRRGRPLAALEPELRRAAAAGDYWMIHAWLGDLAFDREDFAAAAGPYQSALAVIQDEAATPQAPPREVIEHIYRRAEEARLLAADYVPAPRTRSGQAVGVANVNIRGFAPVAIALPVEFEFDSVAFTRKGQAAAEDLLRQLTAGPGGKPIRLVGHTDAAGDAAYNQRLSELRAAAVARFLRAGGYQGELLITGRGEEDPPQVSDPEKFTPDQLAQLARRVELIP